MAAGVGKARLLMHPLYSTFKRRPRKKVVSRSFRIPPAVDRELGVEARKRQWSKSFLIRDILEGWVKDQQARVE